MDKLLDVVVTLFRLLLVAVVVLLLWLELMYGSG